MRNNNFIWFIALLKELSFAKWTTSNIISRWYAELALLGCMCHRYCIRPKAWAMGFLRWEPDGARTSCMFRLQDGIHAVPHQGNIIAFRALFKWSQFCICLLSSRSSSGNTNKTQQVIRSPVEKPDQTEKSLFGWINISNKASRGTLGSLCLYLSELWSAFVCHICKGARQNKHNKELVTIKGYAKKVLVPSVITIMLLVVNCQASTAKML